MDGIVFAGAESSAGLKDLGISRVPLLKVDGQTILDRTCESLLGAGCNAVHVLASRDLPILGRESVCRADYTGDVISDMFNCLENRTTAKYLLVSSADMPLVNTDAMAELAAAGRRTKADIVYPAVEKRALELQFPGIRRTYVRFGRQVVTGGNVLWMSRVWLLDHREMLWQLFEKRKSITALAGFFGFGFLLRIILGLASIKSIERHLSRLLNGDLRAVVLNRIELGIDLDKPADLDTVRAIIDPWEEAHTNKGDSRVVKPVN